MNRYLLTGICLFVANSLFAQKNTKESTTLTLNYGSKVTELMELFRMQNIDYFKITSKDMHLKDYYFLFTVKEYHGEKLTRTDTLLTQDTREWVSYDKKDTALTFQIMAQPKERDSIKFAFNLSKVGFQKVFKKEPVNTYSLRDAINSNGQAVKVPLGKAFPLLVYSLPYEDPKQPGYLFYCALTADGTPPEQWGKKFGVRHLIIIELSILPKS